MEGTTDDTGCHFIYMNTVARIRVSQLFTAINEYNMCVPSTRPVIVTMSSKKKIEGAIYLKIQQDKETKNQRGISDYWSWDPESDNYDTMRHNGGGLGSEDELLNTSKGKKRAISESEDQFKRAKLHPSANDGGCCSIADDEKHRDDVLFHMEETEKYKAKSKELQSELVKVNDEAEEYMLNIEQRLQESEEYKTTTDQRLLESKEKLEQCKKEAEEYTASLQKESEAELKRVKEEALASEQRLLQESETKLNECKKEAEENKASLQKESETKLKRVEENAEERLNECKKEAEENKASLQKESEAELKRVKEDALASEQRLLQESESKLERVERDAEERLNKCKEEYNQCLAKSESELTKIKGEVATHRENAINYETQYEEYKERMEDPYNEEGVEYYKKQFREKMRAISRADYNEVQVSICDRHCKYLGKKVEECENFHEPKIERLEKMVSVIIIII